MLLPITLAIPDPRISNEGDSFLDIVNVIKVLASFSFINEECSWLDGFARIRADPQMNSVAFESTAYQYALAKEKITVSKEQVDKYNEKNIMQCICLNELKYHCSLKEFGICTSKKKMKAYLIAGKDFPSSMLKNKFIILRMNHPYPYKIVKNKEYD